MYLANCVAIQQLMLFHPFQMGFDQLMSLVPSLANQRNAKVSKATVLQKSKYW